MFLHRSTAAQRFRACARVCGLLLFMAAPTILSGCGSGDRPLEEVDPGSVPSNPTYDQVFAIIDRECVSCHQSGGDDESSAAATAVAERLEETNLSDCTSIVAQRDNIWEVIEANTMPPGALPRLSSEERLVVRRWIDNGAPAPCY